MSEDKASAGLGVAKVAAANTPTSVVVLVMAFILRGDIDDINEAVREDERRTAEVAMQVVQVDNRCALMEARMDAGDKLDDKLQREIEECRRDRD